MRRQRNIFQKEEQDITSEKELYEVMISNPPNIEFKVMIIKLPTKLGKRMENTVGFSKKRNYEEESNRTKKYNK